MKSLQENQNVQSEGMNTELAAVDLGSNSFHLIVARYENGHLTVTDKLRERVALASGLGEDDQIDRAAMERALRCLGRFGERVRKIPKGKVRVVGTNTLRQAKNSRQFIEQAEDVLGHPVDVISGREEARLIYLGVTQTTPLDFGQELVVDIGGGSTECILGERAEIFEADSLFMGCVTYSDRFFKNGFTRETFQAAEVSAALELEPLRATYAGLGWDQVFGCSGTIESVLEIARQNAWVEDRIDARALKRLKKLMLQAGKPERLELLGLEPERKNVIAGGLSILIALFRVFGIQEMRVAQGALREGVLHELIGRIRHHEDARDRTIRLVCQRYGVDLEQARRIEKTAEAALHSVHRAWNLDLNEGRQILGWASRLFSIGLSVSHTGYHKHSAYLIQNSDWAGFSRQDQNVLAAIILAHRRKLKREYFEILPARMQRTAFYLACIFRLAYALHRSRAKDDHVQFGLVVESDLLRMEIPNAWLSLHPLTEAELMMQKEAFHGVGISFEVRLVDDAIIKANDFFDSETTDL